MTRRDIERCRATGEPGRASGQWRVNSCPRIPARMGKARAGIAAESRHALRGHERLLQLALNEAEALAWQTPYPDLVFPALAAEKVQAVVDWNRRQQAIRQAEPVLVLAT